MLYSDLNDFFYTQDMRWKSWTKHVSKLSFMRFNIGKNINYCQRVNVIFYWRYIQTAYMMVLIMWSEQGGKKLPCLSLYTLFRYYYNAFNCCYLFYGIF